MKTVPTDNPQTCHFPVKYLFSTNFHFRMKKAASWKIPSLVSLRSTCLTNICKVCVFSKPSFNHLELQILLPAVNSHLPTASISWELYPGDILILSRSITPCKSAAYHNWTISMGLPLSCKAAGFPTHSSTGFWLPTRLLSLTQLVYLTKSRDVIGFLCPMERME